MSLARHRVAHKNQSDGQENEEFIQVQKTTEHSEVRDSEYKRNTLAEGSRKKDNVVETFAQGNKCLICGKKCTSKGMLVNHMRKHTGEKPFVCEFCPCKFNQVCNLVTHIRGVHKLKPLSCSLCNKRFNKRSILIEHNQEIHNIDKSNMKSLEDMFASNLKVGVHDRQRDINESKDKEVVVNEKQTAPQIEKENIVQNTNEKHKKENDVTFNCDVCNKAFKFRILLKKHRKICISEQRGNIFRKGNLLKRNK